MVDALSLIGALAVCGVLLWVAYRMEPHWVSKDARRFTCRVQRLGAHDAPEGRWREMRARVDGDDLVLSTRGLWRSAAEGRYRVVARGPTASRGKVLWLLAGDRRRVVMRIPASSRAVTTIDALAGSR